MHLVDVGLSVEYQVVQVADPDGFLVYYFATAQLVQEFA